MGLQGNVIMLQNRKKTFDDGKILRSFVSAPLRTPSSGYSGLHVCTIFLRNLQRSPVIVWCPLISKARLKDHGTTPGKIDLGFNFGP